MKSSLPPDGAVIGHYVAETPFDPQSIEKLSPEQEKIYLACLLYTSPSPRDLSTSRMPSSA